MGFGTVLLLSENPAEEEAEQVSMGGEGEAA